MSRIVALLSLAAAIAACSGGGATATSPSATPTPASGSSCTAGAPAAAPTGPTPPPAAGLSVASGLQIRTIGRVPGARELAILPNGDLLVGTNGTTIALLPAADSAGPAGPASTFATIDDAPDAGVAFSSPQCTIFVGTQHGVYAIPYAYGDRSARRAPAKIASVRTGSAPPGSDGDVHVTTSVAYDEPAGLLYVSVGSSCDACTETDATRASIFSMTAIGTATTKRARRIRNGIALQADAGGTLWVGDAGQDRLPSGHPYEFVDAVTAHGGVADYGWPDCAEDRIAYTPGAQCGGTVAPAIEFPAYSTIVGIAFSPVRSGLAYGFPAQYRGGMFVSRHGSWHTPGGCNVAPEVDFVPMDGAAPATPVDWRDPTAQWRPFVTGWQPGCASSSRIGRPTGLAVAPDGTLFVADDLAGDVYRIRP